MHFLLSAGVGFAFLALILYFKESIFHFLVNKFATIK